MNGGSLPVATLLNGSSGIAGRRSAESPAAVENGSYDLVADLQRRLSVNQQQRDSLVSFPMPSKALYLKHLFLTSWVISKFCLIIRLPETAVL